MISRHRLFASTVCVCMQRSERRSKIQFGRWTRGQHRANSNRLHASKYASIARTAQLVKCFWYIVRIAPLQQFLFAAVGQFHTHTHTSQHWAHCEGRQFFFFRKVLKLDKEGIQRKTTHRCFHVAKMYPSISKWIRVRKLIWQVRVLVQKRALGSLAKFFGISMKFTEF